MKFEYDYEADALYIRVSGGMVDRTISIETGTLVDVDTHGEVVGIEVIRPARPLPVDQLVDRFRLSEGETHILESMWGANEVHQHRYPFEAPREAAVG